MKISFTGDAMCEYTRLQNYYNEKDKKYCFDDVFSGLSDLFSKSDYNVVNLETPIAGEKMKFSFKNYNFNTPIEFVTALKKANVNMVTTANNHSLDRGIEGLKKTIMHLDAIEMEHTGTFLSETDAHPLLKNLAGRKIAFLSYTYGTEACFNNVYLKKNEKYLINLTRNQELSSPIKRYFLTNPSIIAKVFRWLYRTVSPENAKKIPSDREEDDFIQKKRFLNDIEYCKKNKVDFIILCLHSGGQFNKVPTQYTKEFCEFARNNGVDFVIGNHEHCIQLFDSLNKIVFSLGNLTSDYGIDRLPYDRFAEYSVIFHLYLNEQENCKISDYGFSIVKSIKDNNKIVSKLVSDLYNTATLKEKTQLLVETKMCIQLFLNRNVENIEIKEEYKISDFFD